VQGKHLRRRQVPDSLLLESSVERGPCSDVDHNRRGSLGAPHLDRDVLHRRRSQAAEPWWRLRSVRLGFSAFSDVLRRFGAGPGEIGIDGTDVPDGVGASVSHGCIRVLNVTIVALAELLPRGTPVLIHD
jgi:hypothetical protein